MAQEKLTVELVFKLNRANRGVWPRHEAVNIWETAGVSFISLKGRFDTSTALGCHLLNLLLVLAEFDSEIFQENDGDGRQDIKIGRPRVIDRRGFDRRFGDILERLNGERISRRQAANELGIGYATLKRLLDSGYQPSGPK